MFPISRRQIFRRCHNWIKTFKSFSTDIYYNEYDSAENVSTYDSANIESKVKNPNSVIIRGDIFDINRDHDNDHVRITLKVRRESVTRFGEPYIRSEYFNVNFYGVSNPIKKWKMPKYYTVGDNVSTYSNLCQAAYTDIMYLKGYAMRRHGQQLVRTAEATEENMHSISPNEESESMLEDNDEMSADEMK